MALLNILKFPDPRLRKIAQPIEKIDDSIRQLAEDMLETMYAAPGIGLAATQVNVQKRHVLIRAQDKQGQAFEIEDQELLAVCIQHEIDHLNGKLFVDYLSPLKRQRIRKKIEKQERLQL